MRKLTERQEHFVRVYSGNAAEAARDAGYHPDYGRQLITKTNVLAAVEKHAEPRYESLRNDRQRRKEYWAAIMLNDSLPMGQRLRASELLAKSEGDFLPRRPDNSPEIMFFLDLGDKGEHLPQDTAQVSPQRP